MNEKGKTELIQDSRFHAMKKEAVIVAVYWILMFAGIMLSAYFLGSGDPAQYTYLCGFPLWFSVCILIMIIAILVGIFLLLKVFQDVSLDAEDPEFDYEKGVRK